MEEPIRAYARLRLERAFEELETALDEMTARHILLEAERFVDRVERYLRDVSALD